MIRPLADPVSTISATSLIVILACRLEISGSVSLHVAGRRPDRACWCPRRAGTPGPHPVRTAPTASPRPILGPPRELPNRSLTAAEGDHRPGTQTADRQRQARPTAPCSARSAPEPLCTRRLNRDGSSSGRVPRARYARSGSHRSSAAARSPTVTVASTVAARSTMSCPERAKLNFSLMSSPPAPSQRPGRHRGAPAAANGCGRRSARARRRRHRSRTVPASALVDVLGTEHPGVGAPGEQRGGAAEGLSTSAAVSVRVSGRCAGSRDRLPLSTI